MVPSAWRSNTNLFTVYSSESIGRLHGVIYWISKGWALISRGLLSAFFLLAGRGGWELIAGDEGSI
jgi:hypothetical protein